MNFGKQRFLAPSRRPLPALAVGYSLAASLAWSLWTPAAAAAQGEQALHRILSEFDRLVEEGDASGARRRVESAADEPGTTEFLSRHNDELRSAAAVARALEERQETIRRAAEKLVGQEKTFRTRSGRRKGKVESVTDGGLVLAVRIVVQGRVAGETRITIRWSDLAPEEENRLARGWKPEGPEGAIARAYVALARKDRRAAARALEEAGDHPLAERLREKIDAPKGQQTKAKGGVSRHAGDRGGSKPRIPMTAFSLARLPACENIALSGSICLGRPRTALTSRLLEQDTTLTRKDSPYLISGVVTVETNATLVVEPGAKLYFAPGAKLVSKGRLVMRGGDKWIVLCPGTKGQKWEGIHSYGSLAMGSCIVTGAEAGVLHKQASGPAEIGECLFFDIKCGVQVGGPGTLGTLQHCLFVNNEEGLRSFSRGKASFSNCLFIRNRIGVSSYYYGDIRGSRSTFFRNTVGMRAYLYEHRVTLRACNFLSSRRHEAEVHAEGVDLRENFWGHDVTIDLRNGRLERFDGNVDYHNWLARPVPDALPTFAKCPYLQL